MAELLLAAGAAFAAAVAAVPACRALAIRFGHLAHARSDRWHTKSTPILGGVAIALVLFVVYLIVGGVRELPVLLLGAAVMFAVGLVDDLITLKPQTKFLAAIIVASMFVYFGYGLDWTQSSALDALLTMVWIVGVTNAFNLLDNMDGLAAGVGLIVGAALLGALVLNGAVTPEARYLAVFLGAVAGFLVYNFHPASIFMGDSGSLFIGLNLAVLGLGAPSEASRSTEVLSILGGPLLVFLVPILDTTLVTVSRMLSGQSATQGGRDHTSHRLVAIGLSERGAVAVLWVLAALGGMLAVAIRHLDRDWTSVLTALFLVAIGIFTIYLANVRVYRDLDDVQTAAGRVTAFPVTFMYKRRVGEVLLDLSLVTLAYYAAYRLRFENPQSRYYVPFSDSLPMVVAVQMAVLFAVGAYRGVWKYFGLLDSVVFAKAVFLGTITSVSLIVYVYRFENYSRGVFVIYAALLLLLLCGSRASFRLVRELAYRRRRDGERVVLYGTGGGVAAAARDVLESCGNRFRILGFIDDDPAMAKARIRGYRVLGGYAKLLILVSGRQVDGIVITAPAIDIDRLEQLKVLCAAHGVSLSRLNVGLDRLEAAS